MFSLHLKGEGIPTPGVFLQEWQAKDLWLTRRVRVANTRLEVAVFSAICEERVRVAGKGLREEQFEVESSMLNGGRKRSGKDNAETRRAQRWR